MNIYTKEQAVAHLQACQKESETPSGREDAHIKADQVLLSLLTELGYHEVVKEYLRVARWYA